MGRPPCRGKSFLFGWSNKSDNEFMVSSHHAKYYPHTTHTRKTKKKGDHVWEQDFANHAA